MCGVFLMLCMVLVLNIVLGMLLLDKVKNVLGLFNLMCNFGGVVGLVLINIILCNCEDFYYVWIVESVIVGSEFVM